MSPFLRTTILSFFSIFMFIDCAQAQMFSVGNNGRVITPPSSAVIGGIEPLEFSFTGNRNDLENEGAPDYSFNSPVYRLRLEVPGFQIFGGFGSNLGGNENTNYLNAGINLEGGVNLYNRATFGLQVPLEISAEYHQMTTDLSTDRANEFRQSSILIGGGLGIRLRPAERIRITTKGIPMIGYAVSSHSGRGGVRYRIENRNRIFFDNLFGNTGLVTGIDFSYSDFNADENRFQYKSFASSFMIGVTF